MIPKFLLIGILFQCELLLVATWNIPIPGSNYETTHVVNEMAVKILSGCHADIKEVVIHGDSDKLAIKSLRESGSLATLVYNDASLIDDPVTLRLHHNLFVMTPGSVIQLGNMLLSFKKSLRWNVNAPYFILDNANKECRNARGMLKTAWKMNLIKTYFLCVDSEQVAKIYTYNPYTNRAPKPWEQVSKPTKLSPKWTMFTRRFDPENICGDLTFDRTKHLDGSTVKVAAYHREPETFVPYKKYDESIEAGMYSDNVYFLERMKYSLNVTFSFNIVQPGTLFYYAKNGSFDFLMMYLTVGPDRTHPVFYPSHHIIVNNKGFYTPLENIKNYYGLVTLVSMCILLPITFIVIFLSERRRGLAFAAFEILRLLINAALHTRLDRIALRIFFSMIFLYFLIIHATFQGHLSAFLTKQEYRKNAETLEDLKDPRFTAIHVKYSLESLITDPILREKLVLDETNECISKVIGNDSVACITTAATFLEPAFENKLHVSKFPVFDLPNYYKIRKDWPLEERFNLFLMWLESSGQNPHDWKTRYHARILETQKRIKAMSAPPDIRPISMSMLDWIFIFLMIGLKVATMSLLCERRVRSEDTRRRDNRDAAARNMEIRRCRLINQIVSDSRFGAGSRPRSI